MGEGYRVAWVTLDARDNAPTRLWAAIAEALSLSGIHDTTSTLTSRPPPQDTAGVMNVIDTAGVPVWLFLDETDRLRDKKALCSLETLVRQTPDNLRLVLAARTLPRLHLSRLRLEGRLLEIGMPELAFTRPEAEALFSSHRVRLTPAELDLLMHRTEGWPAGLRLAAMSLGDESTRTAKLAAFPGNDHAVTHYLAEEVLGSHPYRVHQFLRATSICDVISADLATALAGQDNSGEILDRLDRANSLVDRTSRPGGWYRYHPVLRSVLLAELDRLQPFVRRGLHQTAAEWFRDSSQPLTALEHAIAAGHDQLVNELVEAYGLQEILKGHAGVLHRLLSGLPTAMRARPFTVLIAAAAALDVCELPVADDRLSAIDKLGRPLPSGRLRALHSTVKLQRARFDGQVTESPEVLAATAKDRTGDLNLDTLGMINRGIAMLSHGEHAQAEQILQRALELATHGRLEHAVLQSLIQLAAVSGARGDLARMDKQAAHAVEYATARGWARTMDCAAAYTMRGAKAYLQLDSERARQFSALAKQLVPAHTEPPAALATLVLDAVLTLEGTELSTTAAEQVHDRWRCLSSAQIAPQLIAYTAPTMQRIALRAGQQHWATDVMEHVEATLACTAEQALVQAALQAHRAKPGQARRLLVPALIGDAQAVVVTTAIDAWLLEASLLAAADDWHRAHSAMTKALILAVPISALRPFRDGGPPVRDLLVKGAGRFGKLDRFVTTMLAKLPPSSAVPVDQLTNREQELLVELPSLQTAEEIAGALFVSVNTVKSHLRGIYRKLGVNHRRDAVAVARQRGLL
ncbi:LuxR family maltose regulon positive regulatory protein [Kibdelosporangium banguiense]|uniref:LuxR family maltose regulon positive regulatory protein n=1 Tax=Kibdelosporangium banguiense TaxID=1365924 RepID=A0ABS4TKT7_9PSEU|nr:LuxR family maltose regulon positive regulatory protein [Kibdelosporangium banguiense]